MDIVVIIDDILKANLYVDIIYRVKDSVVYNNIVKEYRVNAAEAT